MRVFLLFGCNYACLHQVHGVDHVLAEVKQEKVEVSFVLSRKCTHTHMLAYARACTRVCPYAHTLAYTHGLTLARMHARCTHARATLFTHTLTDTYAHIHG